MVLGDSTEDFLWSDCRLLFWIILFCSSLTKGKNTCQTIKVQRAYYLIGRRQYICDDDLRIFITFHGLITAHACLKFHYFSNYVDLSIILTVTRNFSLRFFFFQLLNIKFHATGKLCNMTEYSIMILNVALKFLHFLT